MPPTEQVGPCAAHSCHCPGFVLERTEQHYRLCSCGHTQNVHKAAPVPV